MCKGDYAVCNSLVKFLVCLCLGKDHHMCEISLDMKILLFIVDSIFMLSDCRSMAGQ